MYDDRVPNWNVARLAQERSTGQLVKELSARAHSPRGACAFFRAGMIEAGGRGIRWIADTGQEVGSGRLVCGRGVRCTQASVVAARGVVGPRYYPETTQKLP